MYTLWIDAAEFENKGGWKLETQFVRAVGQSYLIACDIPGEPVNDAVTEFDIKKAPTMLKFTKFAFINKESLYV